MHSTIARAGLALLAAGLLGAGVFLPSQAWAWSGGGHQFQAELLIDVLPRELRDFLAPAEEENPLRRYVMYPDSWDPVERDFEDFDPELVGQEALATLRRNGIDNRFLLHSNPSDGAGPATSFMLLTRAFKNEDRELAAVWAGSLMHAIGDDLGANHGPLIHYLTYGLSGKNVDIGEGIGLDFGDIDTAHGRELVGALLEGYQPAIVSRDPAEVLRRIVTSGYPNAAFATQRERDIVATYAEDTSDDTIEGGKRAMAELGAEGVRQVADLIVTAWHFANEGTMPELDDAIIRAAERQTQQFLREKPLGKDSIYAGLLDTPAEEPAVGVVLEPTHTFNEGVFRGGTKYLLSAIMHEARREDIAYQPVDVRDAAVDGLPSPDEVPVMIVCAGSFAVTGPARRAFQDYADAGGRYLWVGGAAGSYGDILAQLSASLENAAPHLRPVTREYGKAHLEVIENLSVRFLWRYADRLGDQDHLFVKNPNTPAGWHKPICDLHVVSDDPAIKKLASITDGEQAVTIAAALMEADGERARHVFLPEYLLAPYLLSGEDRVRDPATPQLDRVGRAVLLASLELLGARED